MKRYEIWAVSMPEENLAVVVSGERANEEGEVISIVPLTADLCGRQLATHVLLNDVGLPGPYRALCECIMPVRKEDFRECLGLVEDAYDRFALNRALLYRLDLPAAQVLYLQEEYDYECI